MGRRPGSRRDHRGRRLDLRGFPWPASQGTLTAQTSPTQPSE
jgi:hypothetical protein